MLLGLVQWWVVVGLVDIVVVGVVGCVDYQVQLVLIVVEGIVGKWQYVEVYVGFDWDFVIYDGVFEGLQQVEVD